MARTTARKGARGRSRSRPGRRRGHPRAQVRLLLRRRQSRGLERAPRSPRRQGLRARRDDQPRHPRSAGLHDHDRGVDAPTRRRARPAAGGLWPQVEAGLARLERRRGPSWATRAPAPGVGSLRRARLHAGHDGHRSQPRPQRPARSRAWPAARATSASPGTATGASSRSSATWCSASSGAPSTSGSTQAKARAGAQTDADVPAPMLQELVAELQAAGARTGPGGAFPQDPPEQLRLAINAVFDSWFAKKAMDYRRIHRLPDDWGTAVTVMAMVFGNLGETLRHRRVLQPRPLHRRAPLLRRVPGQRAGRGRGGGHPHPRAADCARAADAQGVPRARRDQGPAGEALPRHAGHGVHGAGGHALPPADARGQADGGRRRCGSPWRWCGSG